MKINMMQLSKFLTWSVTGDGYVGYSTHNKNAHYSIQRDPKHKDYLDVIANKFVGLQDCSVRVDSYTRKDNNKEVLDLRTNSHPLFSRVRDRQYIQNHRVIDPHQLTMLDWEAAAFLYMDDGSLCYNNKGSMITRLSTCAFSYGDNELLRKAFIEKLGIIWNINRNGNTWQLNIAKQSKDAWFKNIEPYIVDSYRYKLPEFLQKETPRTGDDLVYLTKQG
jgi:LAGLIDADG DNA endonuclease family